MAAAAEHDDGGQACPAVVTAADEVSGQLRPRVASDLARPAPRAPGLTSSRLLADRYPVRRAATGAHLVALPPRLASFRRLPLATGATLARGVDAVPNADLHDGHGLAYRMCSEHPDCGGLAIGGRPLPLVSGAIGRSRSLSFRAPGSGYAAGMLPFAFMTRTQDVIFPASPGQRSKWW